MQISVLIPFASSEPHRIRNLHFVKSWYRKKFPEAEIVQAAHEPDRRGWIKALAVQNALENSSGEILIIADADCICESIEHAVQAVKDGAQWAVPHRVTRRLSPASTNSVLKGTVPVDGMELDGKGYASVAGGGITVIRRETYQRIPLDPRFVTTHGEDTSWARALTVLVGKPWVTHDRTVDPRNVALREVLFHLWHPPIPPMGTKLDQNKGLADLYAGARNPRAMLQILEGIKAWKHEAPPEKLPDSGRACAVIVPVMKRPESAKPFMDSFKASGADAHVYAIADGSDIETILAWEQEGATVFCSDHGHTFAQKVNCGYERTSEPYLFFVGDDVQFHSGWMEAATLASKGGAVVSTNDLARKDLDKLAIHPFVKRSYIDEIGMSWDGPGIVAHEGYSHWFVDLEWSELARIREELVFAPDAVVEHLHPLWGKGEQDEVYVLGQANRKADQRLYQGRLNQAKKRRLAIR